jgi:hypothetical protein
MNNKYFASLFCIITLALVPACCKRQEKEVAREDVNTMIELDNSVFETEENADTQKSIVKF